MAYSAWGTPSKRDKELSREARREAKAAKRDIRKAERSNVGPAVEQFPNTLGPVPALYDGLARTLSRRVS